MSLGTVLTLFVVPTFYTIFARNHQHDRDAAELESRHARSERQGTVAPAVGD
jgi:hypothetical protein